MPDQKNISPLLDGFTLGTAISEHHGVLCYPAIKENTNKKYIVKKIFVPATQSQFDAMLLAGAYKDPGDAMEYFRKNGEDILEEAELLKKLSKIEGFLPYDGWQMEPITRRRLGYEVYLVGSYKRSLDKYIRNTALTHLEAVNLALDLCSALSVCRQSGFLYGDLKPSNIYVSEKKEYRIGDLGFLPLDALRYASLPERYFSPYTPPELLDPMASLNLSVDTYAVGMILYQLYNDGHLPFSGFAPAEVLPSPCHADYEMAEIIMKAIHPDPEQRWTDPKDLGKAIASYMQRNSINDIPITPFIPLDVKPEDIVVLSSRKQKKQKAEESLDMPSSPDEPITEQTPAAETITDPPDDVPAEDCEPLQEEETALAEETIAEAVVETEAVSKSEEAEESEPSEPSVREKPDSQSQEDISVSEEVAKIISRADDIIAHEIPEETAFPAEEQQPDPFAFATEELDILEDSFPEDPLMEEETAESAPSKKKKNKSFENTSKKKKFKKFISRLFTLIILAVFSAGGFWYYQNVYLQTIDALTISCTQDEITVLVDTDVEESLLTVFCIDGNGKRKAETVHGGKVTFSDLKPSTQYTIELDMNGFHKLVGQTSEVVTTDATTQILSIQAMAGSEDGSVMLDFTVDGNDPDFWNIRYSAEGEEEKVETVTGHNAMITGLTVGKIYTFTLDGGNNFDLGGETTLQYLASRLILAQDLHLTTEDGNVVTLRWNIPGDVVVENWNVRIYDGYGFEEQLTVTEPKALFTGVDPASHYTVEVTAAGMTQPARITISEDPITISRFHMDEGKDTEIKVSWDYSGNAPEGGWLLTYTVDGSGSQVIPCDKATATISPRIPGAGYKFTLETADGKTVFNNIARHETTEAELFTQNAFVIENVEIDLLKTPEDADWSFETISQDAFTNTFAAGDSASMVLRSSSDLYYPGSNTKILFVFRNAYGNALPELTTEVSCIWKTIWLTGDSKTGELNLPPLPSSPGNYVMELYFDGCSVGQFEITITE